MNKIKKLDLEDEIEKDVEEIIPEKEINNFKSFAFKGRMMELAVAFMVGGAFQKAVESISSNLLMPIINFFISKTGTDWRNLTWTPIEGMTIAAGKCMGSFIDFFLISIILYILYVKIIQGIFEVSDGTAPTLDSSPILPTPTPSPVLPVPDPTPTPPAPTTKVCSHCYSEINIEATRCPFCTSIIRNKKKK